MPKVSRVLFPTDLSRCADQALRFALLFAEKYGADLHMLHAVVLHEDDPSNPDQRFPDFNEIHDRLAEIAGDRMDAAIQAHGAQGLNITKVQERGISAAPVILEYAAEHGVDLIVIGTHGRRGIEHLLLGSVTEEVVRRAPCPVITVREKREEKAQLVLSDILVPVDFSRYSKEALLYAVETAKVFDSRLHLLHVVEEEIHPAFYVTGKTSILELMPEVEEKSKEAMAKLAREVAGGGFQFDSYVVEGRAPREIIKFAETHDMDLIVIGTHGLTGFERFLLGSTTEKVVRHVDCPVLTVKVPEGK